MVESCKKRKSAAETIELPQLKRQCLDTNSSPKRRSSNGLAFNGTETESVNASNSVSGYHNECSMLPNSKRRKTESMIASNSVSGDYDECCQRPNSERTENESESRKTLSCDITVSNSINWGSYKFKESSYCTGSTSESFRETESLDLSSNRNAKFETAVEFEAEDRTQIEFFNAEIDETDVLPADEANSSSYVLSSERWSVNEDAREATRRPTIDQEFEQFFSRLMS